MFVVLLITGFLLSSVVTIQQGFLMAFLIAVFVCAGVLVRRNLLKSYLLLIFLYPLLPSVASQIELPDFNYHEFLFLCFTFWWALKNVRNRNVFRKKPLARILGLFLLFCAFSTCLSLVRTNIVFSNIFLLKLSEKWNIFHSWSQLDSLSSLRFFLNLSEGILFYFITLDVIRIREDVSKALRIIFASAVCVSVLGILQYAFDFRPLVAWAGQLIPTRVNSTFSDANSLGAFIAGAFMIGLSQFFSSEKRVRWKYLLGLGAVLLSLIFTGSRAAWAATCLTFLFVLMIAARTRVFAVNLQDRRSRAGLLSIALLLIVLLSALIVAGSLTVSSMSSAFKGSRGYIDSILIGRISVWTAGWDVFKGHPIFGVGPGSFPRYLDQYEAELPALYAHENAHNYYLQLLAETGVIGAFLFLSAVGVSIWKAVRFLKSETFALHVRLPVYGLLGTVVVILLTSITGHPLLLVKLQYFFWGALGMLWTILPRENSKRALKVNRSVAFSVVLVICIFGPMEVYSILKSRQVLPYEFGFYNWEKDASGAFRWTQAQAESRIHVKDKILKISLRQVNAKLRQIPAAVDLFANGRLLDRVTLSDTDWSEFRYYLLDSKGNDLLTFRIVPDAVFTPSKITQSSDSRTLGTAVRPFEWESEVPQAVGVFSEEVQGGRRFVWTRMQASFPIDRSGKTLLVPLFYNNPQKAHDVVRFYWNRHFIKEAAIHNRGWQQVAFYVPSDSNRGILTIVVANTWNPGRLGLSKDYRELGVGVGEFRWE